MFGKQLQKLYRANCILYFKNNRFRADYIILGVIYFTLIDIWNDIAEDKAEITQSANCVGEEHTMQLLISSRFYKTASTFLQETVMWYSKLRSSFLTRTDGIEWDSERKTFSNVKVTLVFSTLHLPAKCNGVEFRPWVSLQLMFSGLQSFWTLARHPFLAASSRAASPLSKSWMSVSPSFTMSKGVFPSLFFFVGSAPCYWNKYWGYY